MQGVHDHRTADSSLQGQVAGNAQQRRWRACTQAIRPVLHTCVAGCLEVRWLKLLVQVKPVLLLLNCFCQAWFKFAERGFLQPWTKNPC